VPDIVTIDNGRISLGIDRANGCIVSLRNKATGTELIAEPRLVDSFRLLVPLPGTVCNYVFGPEQRLTDLKVADDGATLTWGSVRSTNGELGVRVVLELRLTDVVECVVRVKNDSEHVVEEVWAPIIAGLHGVGDPAKTVLMPDSVRNPLYNFPDQAPNWGYPWPSRLILYPRQNSAMQWIDLHNGSEGLGFASLDRSGTVTGFHLTKQPYTWPPNTRLPADVPRALSVAITKHAFIQPGEEWISAPAIIQPHLGDWHAVADRYRRWADTWLLMPTRPRWLADFAGWQHTIMYTQSDALHYRFADVPGMADAAKEHGYPCVNLVGFHRGGIERGYPDFSPEPRLGGRDALVDAIAACHDKDVQVLLFSKCTRADGNSDWYKNELWRHAVKDRDLASVQHVYSYDTLDSRLPLQGRGRYPVMCPHVPAWQDIMVEQTVAMAELGADGTQYDQVHSAPFVCYDSSHNHHPGTAHATGTEVLLRRIRERVGATHPEFALGGEEPWDALYNQLHFGYCRFNGPIEEARMLRYTFPEFLQTLVVDMHDWDRVNRSLLLGCALDFEIKRWRGTLADAPALARYASEIARIRRALPSTLLHGRFRDRDGARVDADQPGVELGVHDAPNGARSVVISNEGSDDARVRVQIDRPGEWRLDRPDHATESWSAEREIVIPPMRAAVVTVTA
jgi:hypothetical protein